MDTNFLKSWSRRTSHCLENHFSDWKLKDEEGSNGQQRQEIQRERSTDRLNLARPLAELFSLPFPHLSFYLYVSLLLALKLSVSLWFQSDTKWISHRGMDPGEGALHVREPVCCVFGQVEKFCLNSQSSLMWYWLINRCGLWTDMKCGPAVWQLSDGQVALMGTVHS